MSPARPYGEENFRQLLELLAARTPTPGGGSAAALGGAIGGALGCMAIRFSMKRKDSTPETDAVLAELERGLVELAARLTRLADDDADSFEAVRAARKLPQGTPAELATRTATIAAASERSAAVPLATARLCREGMELIDGALGAVNRNLATDAGSGVVMLRAAARCAAWNVLVNLVGDAGAAAAARRDEVAKLLARTAELERRATEWTEAVLRG